MRISITPVSVASAVAIFALSSANAATSTSAATGAGGTVQYNGASTETVSAPTGPLLRELIPASNSASTVQVPTTLSATQNAPAPLLASAPASAASTTVSNSMVYRLGVVDPASGLVGTNFGSVTVTQNNGSLTFVETLATGYHIHDTKNANHVALAFGIVGNQAITVSGLTSGFAFAGSGSFNENFEYGINCTTACGPGYNGGFAGPLSFTISATSGTLSLSSLAFSTLNNRQIYLSSDLVSSGGITGNAGGVGEPAPVPEPATWSMMVIGFGAVGGAIRHRRRERGAATA